MLPVSTPQTQAHLLSAMVHGFYTPGSRFARDLATYGEAVVDDVLHLATDQSPAHRANAFVLMGTLLNNQAAGALAAPLQASSVLRLVAALRTGLQDREAVARLHAVDGLVAAADGGALPLLKVLAGRDPHREVRSRATTALWALSPQ